VDDSHIRRRAMILRLLSIVALLALIATWIKCGGTPAGPAMAAESKPLLEAQTQAGQSAVADQPGGRATVTPGMGKEDVRQAWGPPEEVRKIRTCFGWQEEWVYRGDAKRFGADERVLLFDEGEVLTEIK
jgi:hypothetical protein